MVAILKLARTGFFGHRDVARQTIAFKIGQQLAGLVNLVDNLETIVFCLLHAFIFGASLLHAFIQDCYCRLALAIADCPDKLILKCWRCIFQSEKIAVESSAC